MQLNNANENLFLFLFFANYEAIYWLIVLQTVKSCDNNLDLIDRRA